MDKLSKGEISDLAVTYAVWLLHDGGVSVDVSRPAPILLIFPSESNSCPISV
jgi:hypothetical protein